MFIVLVVCFISVYRCAVHTLVVDLLRVNLVQEMLLTVLKILTSEESTKSHQYMCRVITDTYCGGRREGEAPHSHPDQEKFGCMD